MIWLTWRQFRVQALAVLVVLAAFAATLVLTGPRLFELHRINGLASCQADCTDAADAFLAQVADSASGRLYWIGLAVMVLLPALIGIFWGAPLIARELEAGTHRLVWTQSIGRTRWLTVKVALIGAVTVAAVGLVSLAVTWWAGPIDDAYGNRIIPEIFATRGLVPVGYAAFAFVAGLTAGMLIRRTVPAMAVTLVVVAALMVAMPFTLRPHLAPSVAVDAPVETSAIRSITLGDDGKLRVGAEVRDPDAWVLSNETMTPDGQPFAVSASTAPCGPRHGFDACSRYLSTLGLRQQAEYIPAGRFWTLQWRETAILFGITLLLAGFAFWWLRRRLV